jgi:outer membrane protein
MRRFHPSLSLFCAFLCLSSGVYGQSNISIESPKGGLGWLTRPYRARSVSPINLTNSGRLELLIQGGKLYLSAQDVVALALENNLDIEV